MRWAKLMVVLCCALNFATAQIDLLATRPKIKQALSLRQAVEIALRESPVLRGAVAELRAAEARLQMARSEKRWQLSINTFASTGTVMRAMSVPRHSPKNSNTTNAVNKTANPNSSQTLAVRWLTKRELS